MGHRRSKSRHRISHEDMPESSPSSRSRSNSNSDSESSSNSNASRGCSSAFRNIITFEDPEEAEERTALHGLNHKFQDLETAHNTTRNQVGRYDRETQLLLLEYPPVPTLGSDFTKPRRREGLSVSFVGPSAVTEVREIPIVGNNHPTPGQQDQIRNLRAKQQANKQYDRMMQRQAERERELARQAAEQARREAPRERRNSLLAIARNLVPSFGRARSEPAPEIRESIPLVSCGHPVAHGKRRCECFVKPIELSKFQYTGPVIEDSTTRNGASSDKNIVDLVESLGYML